MQANIDILDNLEECPNIYIDLLHEHACKVSVSLRLSKFLGLELPTARKRRAKA